MLLGTAKPVKCGVEPYFTEFYPFSHPFYIWLSPRDGTTICMISKNTIGQLRGMLHKVGRDGKGRRVLWLKTYYTLELIWEPSAP